MSWIPIIGFPPLFSGFSPRMRAKILGETGPLRQFPHWRALLAYSGLKVRMRRSGAYCGKDKITKKGRILLRKYLGQAAFSLLRKVRIHSIHNESIAVRGNYPPAHSQVMIDKSVLSSANRRNDRQLINVTPGCSV